MSLRQGKNESLQEYMNRFTKEALKVPDLDQKVAMIALQQGTKDDNTLLIEIRNAFTSTDLMNLSHATFGSVLPDKCKLDSLDIDTDFSER